MAAVPVRWEWTCLQFLFFQVPRSSPCLPVFQWTVRYSKTLSYKLYCLGIYTLMLYLFQENNKWTATMVLVVVTSRSWKRKMFVESAKRASRLVECSDFWPGCGEYIPVGCIIIVTQLVYIYACLYKFSQFKAKKVSSWGFFFRCHIILKILYKGFTVGCLLGWYPWSSQPDFRAHQDQP